MKLANFSILLTLVSLSGCVASYTLVQPGVQTLGVMQVTADSKWNLAPSNFTPAGRKGSQTWTQDGLLLDRLIIIPGVPGMP